MFNNIYKVMVFYLKALNYSYLMKILKFIFSLNIYIFRFFKIIKKIL